jgi:hypothetical protein
MIHVALGARARRRRPRRRRRAFRRVYHRALSPLTPPAPPERVVVGRSSGAPGRLSTARGEASPVHHEGRSTSRGQPAVASSAARLLYECCPGTVHTVDTHREPVEGVHDGPIIRPIQEHGIMTLFLDRGCFGRMAKQTKQRNHPSRALEPATKPSADAGSVDDDMSPRRAVPRTPYKELWERGIAVVDSSGRVLNAPVYDSTATPKHAPTRKTHPASMQPTTPRRSKHKLRGEMKPQQCARSNSHTRSKLVFGGPFCRSKR